jgi:hypothetical protein
MIRSAVVIFGAFMIMVGAYFVFSLSVVKTPKPPAVNNAINDEVPDGVITYKNTLLGYSITYPASWLSYLNPFSAPPLKTEAVPDSGSKWIFVGPKNLVPDCALISPSFGPARYINVVAMDGGLQQNRKQLNAKIGGQDYLESTKLLGGKIVYVYTDPGPTRCPDIKNIQRSMIFLIENKNKVFELITDLYDQSTVRTAIESFKFIVK